MFGLTKQAARIALFVIVLPLVGCADATAPSLGTAEGRLDLRASVTSSTRWLLVEVTGPGIAPAIILNLPVGPDSTTTSTIDLPAGSNRQIRVSAVDSGGVHTHRADTTIRVLAGSNPNLRLMLRLLDGGFGVTVTFGRTVVGLSGGRDSVARGDTLWLSAFATDWDGRAVAAPSISWGSSDPSVATGTAGLVTGIRAGSAIISASYNGVAATRVIRVFEPSSVTIQDQP